jgi:quercetin dioxygenase-like cupin family protein
MGWRMSNLARIIDYLPQMPMAEKILTLQAEMLKHPQVEPVTKHTFHAGMYCREVTQPAGVLIVGKVHKLEHFFFVLSGDVAVTIDEEIKLITEPTLLCSKPGAKRAIYAQTDTVFMTIHRLDSTNVEDAENEMLEDAPDSPFTTGNILRTNIVEI